jgi:nucleoside-diphosphate-sugar epimerase
LLALDALAKPGHPANGRAFFISDGAPVVLWEWINTLLQKLGRPPVTRRISARNAYAAGAVMETFWRIFPLSGEPPMTRFVATELSKDHWYSIAAARRDLGYAPKADLSKEMEALAQSVK